jgi:L-fuconolactonase
MPWLDDDPHLNRLLGLADFRQATAGLPVDRFVYVQTDVTPAYGWLEAEWAVTQADAVVAWAPLEDPQARTYLDALRQLGPRIKGIRRLIQSEPDPQFPLRLVPGLRLLPDYGWPFDICIRHHQLPATILMVGACPDTWFVLDHLGKPDIKHHLLDPWRERVAELARLPNVVGCKLSGLVTEADHAGWTPSDLAPYVAHALEVFGPDRLLFGSDWPVLTYAATYTQWVHTLGELIAEPAIWGTNARRVYQLND